MLLYIKSIRMSHKKLSGNLSHKISFTSWESTLINFQNLKRLLKASFIIFYDLECVISSTDNIDFGTTLKTIKIIFFAVISTNQIVLNIAKLTKSYSGEEAIEKFFNDVLKKVNILIK